MSLGPRRPGGHPLARPAVTHHRTGLGSVLGAGPGGAGGAAYGPAYARAEAHGAMPRAYPAPSLSRMSAGGDASAAHSLLEVAVKSAEIRYRKPLSTPIFTLSVGGPGRSRSGLCAWRGGPGGTEELARSVLRGQPRPESVGSTGLRASASGCMCSVPPTRPPCPSLPATGARLPGPLGRAAHRHASR